MATHPYYASALQRLRITADANVPTMATSSAWVTHYNPETVKGWTTSETAAVLVHELEHLLRRHSDRCGDRDHKGWNIAADAEINQRIGRSPGWRGLPRNARDAARPCG
jgi:predicted metal-dependent peptidase